MATTTHIAPIQVEQINNVFYSEQGEGPNIWSNYSGIVIEAKGPDGIYLNLNMGNFVSFCDGLGGEIGRVNQEGDATFAGQIVASSAAIQGNVQAAALLAMSATTSFPPASAMLDFDQNGAGGAGSGNLRIAAVNGRGMPTWNLQLAPSDGVTPFHTFIRADVDTSAIPRLTLPENTNITGNLAVSGTITAAGISGALVLDGDLDVAGNVSILGNLTGHTADFDSAVSADSLTATNNISAATLSITNEATMASATVTGNLDVGVDLTVDHNITAGGIGATTLVANDAQFTTCQVGGSPVRTFANTGSGMVYPGAGIGVSTGSAWGASIDPASLQRTLTLTTTGTSGAATLIGNTLNIPQYAGIPMVYPGAGIGVSTGSAWAASIDPATIAYLASANTFAATQTTRGVFVATGNFASVDVSQSFASIGAGAAGTHANLTLVNSTAPANNKMWNMSVFPNSGAGDALAFGLADDLGNSSFWLAVWRNGTTGTKAEIRPPLTLDGLLTASGGIATAGVTADSLTVATALNAGSANQFSVDANGTLTTPNANIAGNINTGTVNGFHFIASYGDFVELNVSGSKNFRIVDPRDDTKWLKHASLEGPENGLYYQGEITTVDGSAEVTLPDYYEVMNLIEGRTVYLTQTFEDDATEFCMLQASRIVDGKFRIRSSIPSAIVSWMVISVRADIPPLEVVTEMPTPLPTVNQEPPPPPEKPNDPTPNGTIDGAATDEDGTVRAEAPHTNPRAASQPRSSRRTREADRG